MTTIELAAEAGHHEIPSRQRSPRNDPSMRDGDHSHGDPLEGHPNMYSTDEDVGDTDNEPMSDDIEALYEHILHEEADKE